jgi:hypothetical protein
MSSQCLNVRKVASGSGGLARGIASAWHDAVFIKVAWRDRPGAIGAAGSFRPISSGAFVSVPEE